MGIGCAVWVSSIPELREILKLDDAGLGVFLLSGPAGNIFSFIFASLLMRRYGSKSVVSIATVVFAASLAMIGIGFRYAMPLIWFCLSLAVFGAGGNLMNIAANAQAGLVERATGRSVMGSFHATWSATNLGCGLLAMAAMNLDVAPATRFFTIAAVVIALHVAGFRKLIREEPVAAEATMRFSVLPRPLLIFGLVAMVIMGIEGSISDWSGVFFRECLAADQGRKLWGYCAAITAITVGRVAMDQLVNRFGARRVFRTLCLLAAGGITSACLLPRLFAPGLPQLVSSAAGYFIAGLGVSGMIPIVYSRAMKATELPTGSAMTIVGAIGFIAYFLIPVLVGALSSVIGLSFALTVIGLSALLIVFVHV